MTFPRQSRRQPTAPVGLNWGSPLLRDVTHVFNGSSWNWLQNLVTGDFATEVSQTVASGTDDLSIGPRLASQYFYMPTGYTVDTTTPWTYAAVVELTNASAVSAIVTIADTPGGDSHDRALLVGSYSIYRFCGYYYDGGQSYLMGADSIETDTTYRVVLSMDASKNMRMWVNGTYQGIQGGSNTGYGGYGATPNIVVGYGGGGVIVGGSATAASNAVLPLLIHSYGYAWDESDAMRFTDNPWQVLRSPSVSVRIGSAGPTTHSASTAEGSATSASTQSAAATFAAAAAEGSATAADTSSAAIAGTTHNVSVSEGSATAVATQSAAATFAASVAEDSAGAVDTSSTGLSDAQFDEWLLVDTDERLVLVELDYTYQLNTSGSSTVNTGTFYFATAPYRTKSWESPASVTYRDVISNSDLPSFTRSIDRDNLGGVFQASFGQLALLNNDKSVSFLFDALTQGCEARFYVGSPNWDRSEFRLLFTATQERVSAPSRDKITIPLRDKGRLLDFGLVGDAVGGAGSEAARPQPLIYGTVYNYEPIVVDVATLKYRWIGNYDASAAIIGLRDNGVALYVEQGNLGTITEDYLTSGNLTASASTDRITVGNSYWSPVPAANEVVVFVGTSLPGGFSAGTQYWVVDVSGSTFKLSATKGGSAIDITSDGSVGWLGGSWVAYRSSFYDNGDGTVLLSNSPAGRITVDASGDSAIVTTSDAIEDLVVNGAGLGAGSLTGAHSSYSGTDGNIGILIVERLNVLDILDVLARGAAAFYGFDRSNKFVYGCLRPDSVSPGSAIMSFNDSDVRTDSIRLERGSKSFKTVRTQYKRNWTLQDSLSSSVSIANAAYFRKAGEEYVNTASASADDYTDAPWLYTPTMVDSPLFETYLSTSAGAQNTSNRLRDIFWPELEILTFETANLTAYELELGDLVKTSFGSAEVSGVNAQFDPVAPYALLGDIGWRVLSITIKLSTRNVVLSLARRRSLQVTVTPSDYSSMNV